VAIAGRLAGWESPLINFNYNDSSWSPVDVSADYSLVGSGNRWFVRKELFIQSGSIAYSGSADDDEVWSLIKSDSTYQKIGGDENDADGLNAHSWSGRSFSISDSFGHYIWSGRGQNGISGDWLTINSINNGSSNIFIRKYASVEPIINIGAEETGTSQQKTLFFVQNYTGNVGIGNTAPLSKLGITGNTSIGATYGAIAAPT